MSAEYDKRTVGLLAGQSVLLLYSGRMQTTARRSKEACHLRIRAEHEMLLLNYMRYYIIKYKFNGVDIIICIGDELKVDFKRLEKFEFSEVIEVIEITTWINKFLHTLNENFGERVWFVGLQGSYGRGEATETSDIDIVVILDELSVLDIQNYNMMLDTLANRELICGFISGKNEILNWDASDLFQFYYDTKPIKGSLDELLLLIDDVAVNRAIKMGVCNIFHGCVHNMLYEKSEEILRGLYKSASFVVQAICFKQTGNYISHQKDLLEIVSSDERAIVDIFLDLKNGGMIDFNQMSETIFIWSKNWIEKIK